MKRILIDLNVVTVAEWDKKKEAIEFLEKTREDYEVYTPLTFLYRILREWKYKKLADRIFKKFDKITEIFLQEYKTTKICLEKYGMTLRHLTNVLSKKLGIKEEDASLVIYASISEVDYVVTYNRKDLRNIEREIKKFLKERGMHVFEIKLPEELLSSNTSLNLLQSFLCFLPSFSLPSFSNLVSFKLFNTFSFSHISKLQLRLFKVFGYQTSDQPLFITSNRKTLSAIPLKVTADENEAITKLTFNQSFNTATNLTLAFGYLGTVNTRSDTG